jgi:hypothetical protein
MCSDFPDHILPSAVEVNDRVLGVLENPFEMIDSVFKRGAQFCAYLEEDITLSDDAFDLFNWYFNLPNVDDFLCLNLYNHHSEDRPDFANVVEAGSDFSCLGIGFTRDQWYRHFKPNFKKHKMGWDFAITELIQKQGLKVLKPKISRSHHIGFTGGVHYRPEVHDVIYKNNYLYKGPNQTNFVIGKSREELAKEARDALIQQRLVKFNKVLNENKGKFFYQYWASSGMVGSEITDENHLRYMANLQNVFVSDTKIGNFTKVLDKPGQIFDLT